MTVLQLCTAVGALRRHDVVCATLCVHVGPALKVRTPRAALRKRRVRDRVGPPLRTLQLLVCLTRGHGHDDIALLCVPMSVWRAWDWLLACGVQAGWQAGGCQSDRAAHRGDLTDCVLRALCGRRVPRLGVRRRPWPVCASG